MQTQTTTTTTSDKDKDEFIGRTERLAVDAQSILVQKRQDPLKIKKNINQLYYVLKRKPEIISQLGDQIVTWYLSMSRDQEI